MLRSSQSRLNSYSVNAYDMMIIPEEKVIIKYVRNKKSEVQVDNKTKNIR